MGFTATKRGAQLQNTITTSASQDSQDICQDVTEFSCKIGRLEEGMSIPVDRAHTAITLHHFAQISSVAVHRKLTLDNVDMWRNYHIPGKQFCSACMLMCRHDSNPFPSKCSLSPQCPTSHLSEE